MFMIFLTFTEAGTRAAEFMEGHRAWIRRGLDNGAFLLVGSLAANAGGAILAQSGTREDIMARVVDDPLVAEGIVDAEVREFTPSLAAEQLAFLLP